MADTDTGADTFRSLVFDTRVVGLTATHTLRLASRVTTIDVRYSDTTQHVAARVVLNTAFAISRKPKGERANGAWRVTHMPTGLRLFHGPTQAPLLRSVAALLTIFPAVDWSRADVDYYRGLGLNASIERVAALLKVSWL